MGNPLIITSTRNTRLILLGGMQLGSGPSLLVLLVRVLHTFAFLVPLHLSLPRMEITCIQSQKRSHLKRLILGSLPPMSTITSCWKLRQQFVKLPIYVPFLTSYQCQSLISVNWMNSRDSKWIQNVPIFALITKLHCAFSFQIKRGLVSSMRMNWSHCQQ